MPSVQGGAALRPSSLRLRGVRTRRFRRIGLGQHQDALPAVGVGDRGEGQDHLRDLELRRLGHGAIVRGGEHDLGRNAEGFRDLGHELRRSGSGRDAARRFRGFAVHAFGCPIVLQVPGRAAVGAAFPGPTHRRPFRFSAVRRPPQGRGAPWRHAGSVGRRGLRRGSKRAWPRSRCGMRKRRR